MIAAFINGYGHDQILKLGELPTPEPGPNDVLVKIHAASVNPIDFKVRDGKLRFVRAYQFPLILGHDCAGEIIQVGKQVQRFKVGDRVFSRPGNGRTGTFAEYISIDQREIALMPANISYREAASLPLVGLTSWQALLDIAHLKAGQKILIHAGSGGVGTFAIQLAKHVGAEVWTTTSGKNIEFVRSLGADHIINYQEKKFEEQVRDMDVVFDTLGGEALEKSFQVTKPGGWVVSIAGMPDRETAQEMNLNFWKTSLLGLLGIKVHLKAQKAKVNYRFIFMKANGEELQQIAGLVEKGIIKPIVDKTFPLSECQSAIEYSASGRARGKIIVDVIS